MKKIALIVLSLSFCFFVPLISIEFFLRAIPNDFNEKSYYFHRNKEKIEVLILGSSHTFVGVDPNALSKPAFSLAYSSQTLDLDELIFDRVKNELPNLKTVIIPVSYFSYPLVLEDGTSHQKIKNYNGEGEVDSAREALETMIDLRSINKDNEIYIYYRKK